MRGTDAGEVRSRAHALVLNVAHHGERTRLRGATRAIGHGAKLGLACIQRLTRSHMLGRALGRLGGEKLKADGKLMTALVSGFCGYDQGLQALAFVTC